MTGPRDAILAVTHRCNAHCVMCGIWQSTAEDRLAPDHLANLPASLRTLNLSGGEPFLRNDLPDFVAAAREACPKAVITLSTNGYLPDRIVAQMRTIRRIDPAVRLAVSIDGIGPAHDAVRGDEGAFDRARETLDRLLADGFDGLRLSMTLSRDNLDQLAGVAELADRLGLELGLVSAHDAPTHLGTEGQPAAGPQGLSRLAEQLEPLLDRWLRSWRPKLWARAHFAAGTYLRMIGRPWRFACAAGRDFFFCQADGEICHCSVHGRRLGNLIEDDFDALWNAPAARAARRHARACPTACWMICTARSVYRQQAPAVMQWMLRHKWRAHLGRPHLPPPGQGGES